MNQLDHSGLFNKEEMGVRADFSLQRFNFTTLFARVTFLLELGSDHRAYVNDFK